MSSSQAAHRTIVYVDVESFGDPRRTRPALLCVRAGLWATMQEAFRAAGIPWSDCHTQDCGDGILVLAPGEPKAPFVEALPGAVARALREHNATHPEREKIRLRMVLHAGEISFDETGFTGNSLVLAARLLSAEPVRAALKASSGALVLVVSQWFYDEVVSQSSAFEPGSYRAVPVRVKETTATGWVSLPDDRRPSPKAGRRRTAAAVAVAGALLLSAGLAADARVVRPAPRAGDDYPVTGEFVAKVLNQRSHKCIARNGAYSQDDETQAERVGEHIFQWDCAEPDADPGHTLVLAPLPSGWAIRSSVKLDLCLAADGAPGQDQRFQACKPQDDRQRWQLRRVLGHPNDRVLIKNENTKLCLAFAEPAPTSIILTQAACELRSATEWEIRRYPGIGREVCTEASRQRLQNHETRRHVFREDGQLLELSVTTAGQSAHGCATTFADSSGRCLGLTADAARLLPCADRPDQQWIIEPMGGEGGLAWNRIHSLANLSRCLEPDGTALTVRRCGTPWLQQWHIG